MLEKIREGTQGVIAKTILVLIILSFALTGVRSYLGSSTEVAAATVNGEDISKSALEQAYQKKQSQLQQQLGDNYETLASNDAYLVNVKKNVLKGLVDDKLTVQAATKLGLTVSDKQIDTVIRNEPAFQTDGAFDNDKYVALIQRLNYNGNSFRDGLRVDMIRRQLLATVINSEFVLPNETEYLAKLQQQTRNIRYHLVDASPLIAKVKVSDDEAKRYYQDNQGQFVRPETLALDYIELDAAKMADNIIVTDKEVQDYYNKNSAQYASQEKRLAAHILVKFGDDETAAKTKAQNIYAKLQAGASFAKLAKTESDDAFSGKNGGRLDWFKQGVMEPAFDQALFKLKKGQYSGVIKTSFGFHIIKLLDIQPSLTTPFAKVKADIAARLKKNKAVDNFYGLQQKLADTSYESPDTLVDAAKDVGIAVKTSRVFSRDNAPEPLNTPKVLKAAFSNSVIRDGMNSDVIKLGDNHVIVVRAKSHTSAGSMSFNKVKAAIIDRLKTEGANKLAHDSAQTIMTAIKKGDTSVSLTTKNKLKRFDSSIDSAIVSKAFQMPRPKKGIVVNSVASANGYAVIILDKINSVESVDKSLVDILEKRLNSQHTNNDYRALIAQLRAKGDITYPSK